MAQDAPRVLVARVETTGFLRIEANSFQSLSPQQQALAYWLTQASIAIHPIIFDQLSAYGLRQKRVLEEIVARPAGIAPATLRQITQYTQLFWANRGNHNLQTSQKFLPHFSFEELMAAVFMPPLRWAASAAAMSSSKLKCGRNFCEVCRL